MIINAEQMSAFESQALRNFSRRLANYFQSKFSGRLAHNGVPVPHGEELVRKINELVDIALTFRIIEELGVGQFVALGLGYSDTFYKIPRVAAMLTNGALSPEENIQRVINAVIVAEARGV